MTHKANDPPHPHPWHDPPHPQPHGERRDPHTLEKILRRKREKIWEEKEKEKILRIREEENWDSKWRLRDIKGQRTKKIEKKRKY